MESFTPSITTRNVAFVHDHLLINIFHHMFVHMISELLHIFVGSSSFSQCEWHWITMPFWSISLLIYSKVRFTVRRLRSLDHCLNCLCFSSDTGMSTSIRSSGRWFVSRTHFCQSSGAEIETCDGFFSIQITDFRTAWKLTVAPFSNQNGQQTISLGFGSGMTFRFWEVLISLKFPCFWSSWIFWAIDPETKKRNGKWSGRWFWEVPKTQKFWMLTEKVTYIIVPGYIPLVDR
jgi:hypothetical protein